MSSEVEICNLALGDIRAGSINSLNESSIQAQQCKLRYPVLRDQLLRDVPWQFTHKIKALALLTDELFNWAYVYQYPADCIQINRLMLNWEEVESGNNRSRLQGDQFIKVNLKQQIDYKIYNIDGNKVIASNESDLRADYTAEVTDPNLFDTQFIVTLSKLLAAELAIPLVGVDKGRQLRSDSYGIYQSYLNAAIASNENEQYTQTPDSEFVNIR